MKTWTKPGETLMETYVKAMQNLEEGYGYQPISSQSVANQQLPSLVRAGCELNKGGQNEQLT